MNIKEKLLKSLKGSIMKLVEDASFEDLMQMGFLLKDKVFDKDNEKETTNVICGECRFTFYYYDYTLLNRAFRCCPTCGEVGTLHFIK